MESVTTPRTNRSEDSGFASTSNTLEWGESTPNIAELSSHTRKRKFSQTLAKYTLSPLIPLSSTLNESIISRSFERCNISSFTPNFYVERSPVKKQRSEPSTPNKREEETAFYRLHTDSFQKTPTKCIAAQRLGSPESNEILYGGELKANSVNILSSRLDKFKRHSPAKKRLFKSHEFERRRRNLTQQHIKIDPVQFLTQDRNTGEIMSEILTYLNDVDLYAFSQVNRTWRRTICTDEPAKQRLHVFIEKKRRDKENYGRRFKSQSPCKLEQHGFYKIVNTLKAEQRLDKCPMCIHISIIDKNIGQCQNDNCGYIYCLNCSSFSTSGPENFTDKCNQSLLICAKRASKSLLDSPKREYSENEPPSFLLDNSYAKFDSSGYSTDLDASPLPKASPKLHTSVLGAYNRELPETRAAAPRRNSFVPVVTLNRQSAIEVMEPSSPPKIKNVACSSKSKKNLRRLIRN